MTPQITVTTSSIASIPGFLTGGGLGPLNTERAQADKWPSPDFRADKWPQPIRGLRADKWPLLTDGFRSGTWPNQHQRFRADKWPLTLR